MPTSGWLSLSVSSPPSAIWRRLLSFLESSSSAPGAKGSTRTPFGSLGSFVEAEEAEEAEEAVDPSCGLRLWLLLGLGRTGGGFLLTSGLLADLTSGCGFGFGDTTNQQTNNQQKQSHPTVCVGAKRQRLDESLFGASFPTVFFLLSCR